MKKSRSSVRKRIQYEEVEPDELRRFLCWFAGWHTPAPLCSVLTTCMTGRFKCSSTGAELILRQAITLGMVEEHGGRAVITVSGAAN